MTPERPSTAAEPNHRSAAVRVRVARLSARGAGLAARVRGGRASVFPGYIALKVAPDLLNGLLVGRTVCLVSGTNGKTTTTALVASSLGDAVVTNRDGANLPAGWVSALLDAEPGPVVLEVDESYLPAALDAAPGAVVALLNLSRDQLDRHSETRMLALRWRDALTTHPDAHVVANVDDPLVVWAAEAARNVTWVAGGAEWHSDAAACPACGALLTRTLGSSWTCPGCSLTRPVPTIESVPTGLRVAGEEYTFELALPGRANRGNVAMAVGAACALGVPARAALDAMVGVREVSGRYARHRVGDHDVIVLLAKNPAGWVETLDVIDDLLPDKSGAVVVAINARGPDGRDPSWLWDVPFEQLAGREVIATGERATDLAVRLDHAGVDYRKDTRAPLLAARAAHQDPVVIAATYTNFLTLSRELDGVG